MTRLSDLWHRAAMAVLFLTRMPLPRQRFPETMTIARAAPFFPLVGFVCGGLSVAVFLSSQWLGLSNAVSALLSISVLIIMTGALHEDGLADCADGFYGGHTKTRRLEIMRDSRIGSYGVIALVLVISLRILVIASLPPPHILEAILLGAILSRTAMVLMMRVMASARADGLGKAAGQPSVVESLITLALALSLSLMIAPPMVVIVVGVGASAGALLVMLIAWQKIGGATGDVYGAGQQFSEVGVLLAISMISVP